MASMSHVRSHHVPREITPCHTTWWKQKQASWASVSPRYPRNIFKNDGCNTHNTTIALWFPMPWRSALKSHNTSWFNQNLSRHFSTWFGKLFQIWIIRLVKLIFLKGDMQRTWCHIRMRLLRLCCYQDSIRSFFIRLCFKNLFLHLSLCLCIVARSVVNI